MNPGRSRRRPMLGSPRTRAVLVGCAIVLLGLLLLLLREALHSQPYRLAAPGEVADREQPFEPSGATGTTEDAQEFSKRVNADRLPASAMPLELGLSGATELFPILVICAWKSAEGEDTFRTAILQAADQPVPLDWPRKRPFLAWFLSNNGFLAALPAPAAAWESGRVQVDLGPMTTLPTGDGGALTVLTLGAVPLTKVELEVAQLNFVTGQSAADRHSSVRPAAAQGSHRVLGSFVGAVRWQNQGACLGWAGVNAKDPSQPLSVEPIPTGSLQAVESQDPVGASAAWNIRFRRLDWQNTMHAYSGGWTGIRAAVLPGIWEVAGRRANPNTELAQYSVVVPAGGFVSYDLTKRRDLAVLMGRVLDGDSGLAVEGAAVAVLCGVLGSSNHVHSRLLTDEEGWFQTDGIPFGRVEILVFQGQSRGFSGPREISSSVVELPPLELRPAAIEVLLFAPPALAEQYLLRNSQQQLIAAGPVTAGAQRIQAPGHATAGLTLVLLDALGSPLETILWSQPPTNQVAYLGGHPVSDPQTLQELTRYVELLGLTR